MQLILSRSLAHPQGKILGAAVSTISRSLSSASLSSSAALPLESGCKGTDFFLSCNFYTILFCRIFSGSCLTRWFTLCYKAYFLLLCRNPCEIPYIMKFVRARTCTRVRKKGMVLTEMKGFSGTFTHQKNASAFDIKRKCVSLQTQGRFTSNARTFHFKRKDVSVQTEVYWK